MKILLFVSSHCPHCPKAESVVKKVVPEYYKYGMGLEKIRIKTAEGKELTSRFNVMTMPTIIMLNDKGAEIQRIGGVPSEDNLKNKIEKELGLKKSFLSRFFGDEHESQ